MSGPRQMLERIVEVEKALEDIEKKIEKERDTSQLVEEFRRRARQEIEGVLAAKEKAMIEEIHETKREILRKVEVEVEQMKKNSGKNMDEAVTYVVDLVLGKA